MTSAVQHGDQGLQSKVTFQEINIDLLHESKHNPRRHFDGPAMAQLVESIRKAGMLTPLRVRPNEKGFEIAAGHRRYRAAKLVPLKTVPCVIGEMSDQVFMEFLTIENLQREDVHPLDEAGGYEDLMAAPYKMKVEVLAQKVGKSIKYVYDRIKLLELTKPARDLFWSGMIEAGHAIHLARLTPSEQAKVIGTKDNEYADGGLFKPEHRLFLPDEDQGDEPHVKSVSVRELQAWIDEHVRFTGKSVDPMLFPETAAQITKATEMKRKIIEITHEYLAPNDVRHADKAKVFGERAWTRADGHEESQVCDYAALGVIASGPGRGQAFDVCVRKDKCLVHWGKEIRAREKRAKELEKGGSAATKAQGMYQKEEEKRKREHEQFKARDERWQKARPKILEAVAAAVKKAPTKATGLLGKIILEHTKPTSWDCHRAGQSTAYLPLGKTADDLIRSAAFNILMQEAVGYQAMEHFPKLAKAFGVDTKKILDEMAPVKPEVHTSAVKGKKGKAA
jgi:ParB/RepB/Spo0J family partition protein